jgi:tetratricopeptide (TPR) repeat protein
MAFSIFSSASFCCLWKLLGDALILMHALPKEVANLRVPSILLPGGQQSQDTNTTSANKLQLLQLASKAFIRALNIQPENVSCWQNLALSFHFQLLAGAPTEDGEIKAKAFTAIRRALSLSPKDNTLWNVLGVFAALNEDMALAQHAFIRSITLESNSTAWSNLGIMYFSLG